MTQSIRLMLVVVVAVLLGWATPVQAQVTVGYYSSPTVYYPPTYYPTGYYAGPYWGSTVVPNYSYWYGYQYRWNYTYRPWTGYSSGPRSYSPPTYWGYSVRPTFRAGYWRSW